MHFPVRKCYHALKICLLVVLVVSVLSMFEQWRGGKRGTVAIFSDPVEAEYERQILEDEARIIPGLGEGGVAAHLTGEDKLLGEESEKKLAINVHLSDRISYNRSLKDYRNPACERVVYDAELPSASVILIFHNEPYSVVVRTIWSVLNSARRDNPWFKHANFVERDTGRKMTLGSPGQDPSSPFVYLKEIILVDDNSTLPELKGKLSHYVRTRLPPDMIRILRLPDRVGLTRARLAGARYATGDVLVFLDSHCEGQTDWLRPLLQRIKGDPHAVVVPIIDVIDSSNFYYSVQDQVTFQVGGFNFMGHFTWIEVPEREKKRRGSDIAPTWSPTMAGGLFAINRAYYWELGAYDEQMAGWGGENLEMSFRIWQCGGTLETIPCSRVGHVFRSFHPYGLPAHTDTHGINTARMAEVWMDEYAELFYLHRPDLRKNPKIGDVTHRKILREKLKCKSFQWYLDNVYKEKFIPVRDVYGYGRFSNPATNMCLDTLQREGANSPLGVYPCHQGLQATQYFSLSSQGQLRDEESCAELQHNRDEAIEKGRRVLMAHCHGKRGQKWRYLPSSQLQHMETGLCLDAGLEAGADVMAKPCRADEPSQRWKIDYNQDNDFKLSNKGSKLHWLQHMEIGLFLDAGLEAGVDVMAKPCRADEPSHRWKIDCNQDNDFKLNNEVEPSEQEVRLSKLRRQRRISRSLLSYTEEPPLAAVESNTTVRRHTHKKRRGKHARKRGRRRRTKNKFILKLVRRLANNSEEHLEVDIHCKHKKLYPNNSFVRDLVTVLNEKDIKVINNGRVFERTKVSELDKGHGREGGEQKVLNKMDIIEPTMEPVAKQAKRWRNKKRKHEPVMEPMEPMAPIEPFSFDAFASLLDPPRATADTNDPPEAPEPPASDPAARKIIIEDFVQITPTTSAPDEYAPVRVQKYRKRKRTRNFPSQPTTDAARPPRDRDGAEATPGGDEDDKDMLLKLFNNKRAKNEDRKDDDRMQKVDSDEDALKVDPPASAEDAPPLSSAEPGRKRDAGGRDARDNALERDTNRLSDEDWAMGETRFRTGNDSAIRRNRQRKEHALKSAQSPHRVHMTAQREKSRMKTLKQQLKEKYEERSRAADTDAGSPSLRGRKRRPTTAALPVKVVMRSNLTFNLGDDFFAWRRRSVNDLLGELTIPANSSQQAPPTHAWILPEPLAKHKDEKVATAAARSDSEEDSSSSDSSSE